VVIDPGDMLCFSGAHLHASAANVSGFTRFSIESRTVNIDDLRHNRAAPNIDCQARQVMFAWFRHVVSNESLTDEIP
jgi:ectoine hydroxylase-related dioxygenase (phytanoyl-CoA dioxygenase family)